MPESSDVGQLLRDYRRAAGFTQHELAERAGLKTTTISDIERGLTLRPQAKTLTALAEALGLSAAETQRLRRARGAMYSSGGSTPFSAGGSSPGERPEPSAVTLADALRRYRARSGRSAREIAVRAGISARTVKNVEAGLTLTVRPGTARLLADALELAGDECRHFLVLARGAPVPTPVLFRTPPSTLRGRTHEYAVLLSLVYGRQLVTVTGVGGVGKTALADAVLDAVELPVRRFGFEDVGRGTDAGAALAALAGPGGDGEQTLERFAGELPERGLVLLDNMEHLAGTAAAVGTLLALRADVRVLVTSRTALGAQGEHTFALRPLPPEAAGQVFRDAAEAAGRPVPPTTDPEVVTRICARLDGLPLAVRLAAAWTRLMAPEEILARLDHPARMLTAPGAAVPAHHTTMDAAVAWSLDLLDPHATAVFETMATLPAPWPLDLLEEVHGDPAVLEGLTDLLDAQLVTVEVDDGVSWFTMLQPVRDVGWARILRDPGRLAATLDRHSGSIVDRAETAAAGLVGDGLERWLDRIDRLYRHYENALARLTAGGDPRAVRLASALWRYWQMRGRYRVGLTAVREALAAAGGHAATGDAPPGLAPSGNGSAGLAPSGKAASGAVAEAVVGATARYGAAVLGHLVGENPQATEDALAALATYEQHGDIHGVGSALSLLGMITLHAGDPRGALAWYERGLREVGWESAPRAYTTLQGNVAPVYAALGDLPAAIAAAEEAATRYRLLNSWPDVAAQLGNIGGWSARLGDVERGRALLREADEVFRALGHPAGQADAHGTLTEFAVNDGELAVARAELELTLSFVDAMDERWVSAMCAVFAAELTLLEGRPDAAILDARVARAKAEPLCYREALLRAAFVQAAAECRMGRSAEALAHAVSALELCRDGDARVIVSLAHVVALARPEDGRLARAVQAFAARPGCAVLAAALAAGRLPEPVGSQGNHRPGSDRGGADEAPAATRCGVVALRDEALATARRARAD